MVELEKMKYKQQQVNELEDLKEDATNDVMDTLQDGLKEMALQNITMRKVLYASSTPCIYQF